MSATISSRCMTACGACAPSSICARIRPGAGSSPRSGPRFPTRCSRRSTACPGRVRRILRQRSDKDILAGARIDATEVDDAAALIDFVAVCRTYAGELAINEVTLRTYSDLQQYVEKATEALVQSLARRRSQGASLPAGAGRSRGPFLRGPVRPRVRVPDEQGGRQRARRRTQIRPRQLEQKSPLDGIAISG